MAVFVSKQLAAPKLVEVIPFVPSAATTPTYSGSAQSPAWTNYNEEQLQIGGTYSAVNAGSYTAAFTPKEGYIWADGSAETKSVSWSIAKAPGSVSLSTSSISLYSGGNTARFTVSRVGNGAISVASSSTSRATASLSGTTVTVRSGNTAGYATITVTVAEADNYLAASANCGVTIMSQPTYSVSIGSLGYGITITIGGTAYSGPATVTVTSGTSYRVYMPPNDVGANKSIQLNGRTVASDLGGSHGSCSYSGTVTSNMTVSSSLGNMLTVSIQTQ